MAPRAEHGFWRTFSSVLLASVLLLVIGLAIVLQVVPRVLGGTSLTVLTGSMQPTLNPGDVIAIRSIPVEDIRIGDIVTYQAESNDPALITHRVTGLGFNADGIVLTMQGDANGAADPPVVAEQVRGVYMYRVPLIGHVFALVGGSGTLLVTVLGVALLGYALFAFIRPYRREKRAGRGASTVALVVALAVTAIAVTPPAPAVAADELDVAFTGPTVNLSWKGETYQTANPGFFGDREVSPGDRVARQVRVTNDGPTDATLTALIENVTVAGPLEGAVTIGWRLDGAGSDAVFQQVRTGDSVIVDDLVIARGDSILLTLLLAFPDASTQASRAAVGLSSLTFNVRFVLTEAIDPPEATEGPEVPGETEGPGVPTAPGEPGEPGEPGPPLAGTGGLLATGAIGIGLIVLSAGIALVLTRARRTRRAD